MHDVVKAPTARRTALVHLPFAVLLALAAAVRVVVMVAYQPALMFPDSYGYLRVARYWDLQTSRPDGYSVLLWPIVHFTGSTNEALGVISVVHHLLGLGLALVCYAFLLRRGLPWWGACLAVLPVLFDPLQLVMEAYPLSDLLFEVQLVVACVLILWRRRPGWPEVVLAGLLLGWAAVTRGAGSLLVVVFVVALLCLRVRPGKVIALLVAAVIPFGAYVSLFHAQHGEYATVANGPRFMYARLAPFVHCGGVQVPEYEKKLCPPGPVGHRRSTDYFMWANRQGPQYHVSPPPGMTQVQVVKDWDKRMVRAEPVTYTRLVLSDFARGFVPSRAYEVPGYPAKRWLFHSYYWSLDEFIRRPHDIHPRALKGKSYDPAAARFMTAYGKRLWTPGPLMGLLLVVAVVTAFGVGRARASGDRVAIGLLTATCLVPLLTCAALSGFSWRYQLPQIPLLPMAAALGLAALVRGRAPGRTVDPPLRLLDRMADWPARLPLPARARVALSAAAERGRLQPTVAVITGAVAGALAAVVTLLSGWVKSPTAAAGGATVAVVVAVLLLVSRARAARDGVRPAAAGRSSALPR